MTEVNQVIEMQRNGVLLNRSVGKEKLKNLMRKIGPKQTNHELIRIGGQHDGGYLVPNDLKGVIACFSPGVSDTATFEEDLLKKHGINSHQIDYTVDGPPHGYKPLSFEKKFIGAHNDEITTTMASWIKSKWEFGIQGDFLLQMDIEGSEFHSLLATPDELLQRFRIVVLELHWIEQWASLFTFPIVEALFNKLLQHYVIVHFHANNYAGTVNVSDYEMPRVIELTMIRRDRCAFVTDKKHIEHPLDNPCNPEIPEIVLNSDFFELN